MRNRSLLIVALTVLIAGAAPIIAEAESMSMDSFPSRNAENWMDQGSEVARAMAAGEDVKESRGGTEILELKSIQKRGKSMGAAMVLDLLFPGGGHFYREDYISGFAFFALKGGGAYAVYHFTRRYFLYRSSYRSARRARWMFDPLGIFLYKDPYGNWKSLGEIRKGYHRAAQMIILTSFCNLVVYTLSLVVNYLLLKEFNERAIPTFDFYSKGPLHSGEKLLTMRYSSPF